MRYKIFEKKQGYYDRISNNATEEQAKQYMNNPRYIVIEKKDYVINAGIINNGKVEKAQQIQIDDESLEIIQAYDNEEKKKQRKIFEDNLQEIRY